MGQRRLIAVNARDSVAALSEPAQVSAAATGSRLAASSRATAVLSANPTAMRRPSGEKRAKNGCLPPGQAKKWRKGAPLPAGVVYYDVPRSVVLTLGVPPAGYKYVRVAADILMIAVGTSMVIDAVEDLMR